MVRSILYIFLLLLPLFSYAVKKDTLKDNKVYLSGGGSIYTLIELRQNHIYLGKSNPYIIRSDWSNHHGINLGFNLEWKKWIVSINESYNTGKVWKNYIFENKDRVQSTGGDISDYQSIFIEVKCPGIYTQIGFGRSFNIPKTKIKFGPQIGVGIFYGLPRKEEFSYSNYQGPSAYSIEKVIVGINTRHYSHYQAYFSLNASYSFQFGEIGVTSFLTYLSNGYSADFYTDLAYAYSDDGFILGFGEIMSIGISYKRYFNK